MNRKVMLINATDPEEIRVATLVDGSLSDFDIEFVHNEKIKGNIYKARVVRVDTSLQAAFIHYGGQKNGFLPIGELPRDMVSPDGRRGRIQDLLHKDQEILVQAVREELGAKGAMMTAQISLPGRYLVLTPGNPMNGISRKIESREEREHFKKLIDELEIPNNFGVIVRTASLGVTKDDFQRDLEYLLDTYKEVQHRHKHRQGAGLVWQEDDVVTRTLRDCFSADMEEVYIDDLETFHAAQGFFKRTMPQHAGVLKHYVGKKPLFAKYQTEEQIDRIYSRKVNLPAGGALVIDQTEALVAIDVNSGKTSGEGVEDMAFKTNMEAAEEAARQLRLRDLAGLVVIDFIDMKKDTHNRAVQERLVECLREDKARMEVGKINRFGVLVMTRQRIRPSLQHVTHENCPVCQGSGKVKNLESLVLSVVRRLKSILSKEGIEEVRVKLAPTIAMAVLNQKRKDLAELEEAHEARILIQADPELVYGEMSAEIDRREEEPAEKPAADRRPERPRDSEDETVVLGGDAPISFEKALAEPTKPSAVERGAGYKYDRRDAQKAALEERDRLRALFESAKPENEAMADAEAPAAEAPGRRRGRGRRSAAAAESVVEVVAEAVAEAVTAAAAEPATGVTPEPEVVVQVSAPEPPAVVPAPIPVLDVASLITPLPRPKKLGAAESVAPVQGAPMQGAPKAEEASVEAPAKKRGRPRKAVGEAVAEPVAQEVPAAEPAGKSAAKPRRTTKAKTPKTEAKPVEAAAEPVVETKPAAAKAAAKKPAARKPAAKSTRKA
nr:Rne/Rng family ribonuclease [uncultured Holophaga sp.]